MGTPEPAFTSPLRLTVRNEFTDIGFGPVAAGPEIVRLRQALNACLFRTAAGLPGPLVAEARATLSGYTGGDGDFFRLFYVPIWSFLHWVPAAAGPIAAELREEAQEAHALALFLHLWDDHLCDGQLELDMLRLHLRTLAWQRYVACARSLCRRTGADPALVDGHVAEYVESVHCPVPASDPAAYGERFRRQIAIWTLTPRLLGHALGGPAAAAALVRVIAAFAQAWRWLDDLQDVHLDLREGKETAVWLELDAVGRQRWAACRDEWVTRGRVDPPTWAALALAVRESGCLQRLLGQITAQLHLAAQTAGAHGWWGISRELEQCRQGLPGGAQA